MKTKCWYIAKIYRLKSFWRSVNLKNFLPWNKPFKITGVKNIQRGRTMCSISMGYISINSRIYKKNENLSSSLNWASHNGRRISALSSCSQKGSDLFPGLHFNLLVLAQGCFRIDYNKQTLPARFIPGPALARTWWGWSPRCCWFTSWETSGRYFLFFPGYSNCKGRLKKKRSNLGFRLKLGAYEGGQGPNPVIRYFLLL